MADKHNTNIPAIGNQISADIPDIKENLEYHKDAFERIFSTWNDTTITSNVFGPTNGSYTFGLPTNGVSAAGVFMTGNSNTVAWFYLNTAPPGWKVLATGADSVLAVSGGTAAYNVNGGNGGTGDTWTQPGHTHTGPSHTHAVSITTDGASTAEGTGTGSAKQVALEVHTHDVVGNTDADGTDNTGSSATANTWRPLASVGKLFQLDTA